MAAADTNVRPRRQAPAVTARGARHSALARLLLLLLELIQLDRKLLLLFAASLMPACIIPVGPNWQDPPGERNHTPELVSFMPPVGMRVTTSQAEFRVLVSDPDGDLMFAKWFADFPPFMQGISFIDSQKPIDASPGTPGESTFTPTCPDKLSPSRTTHQILVAISDRRFLEVDGADPLMTEDGPAQIQLAWTLERACQPPSP